VRHVPQLRLFRCLLFSPANKHTKFQLSSSIRFGDMQEVPKYMEICREFQNKNWELLILPDQQLI